MFLTGKDVLPEKRLIEKTATIKSFEYAPLGSELEKNIAKKQHQGLNKVYKVSPFQIGSSSNSGLLGLSFSLLVLHMIFSQKQS